MDNRLEEFEKGHEAFQKIKFKQSKERFKRDESGKVSTRFLFNERRLSW